ncbi:MAG: carboxypeptidase regulatory-like domain-containing protein, partial [Bacteroidales bacterium]|nr:carboxypeptidase regulatory-like domain-containing protein [Bacteroidales bacterium]
MRKLFLLFLGLAICSVAQAQVIILSSDTFGNPESEVKIKLVDSLTQQPLPMATVYLQPKGDTTIMYFNLSDTSGTAVLDGVVRGSYKLTAEFLGYRPFVKEFYFRKKKEDLGTVKMVEDAVLLEAATVSAVGNPVEIIK